MDYENTVELLEELMNTSLRVSSQLLLDKHSNQPLSLVEKNSVITKIIQCMHVLQQNM